MRSLRKRGFNQKHILLVGSSQIATEYKRNILAHPKFGFTIDGYVSDCANEEIGKHLGQLSELEQILNSSIFDEVVIANEFENPESLRRAIQLCEKSGTKLSIIPFPSGVLRSNPVFDTLGDCRLIRFREIPLDSLENALVKRMFDIVGSIILITLTIPIQILIALTIKITSPGPIFFNQTRMGMNRKNFEMIKFRSMHVNHEENTAWTTHDDNRKTMFGSFIRKISLDELPQFYNVLKGEMSLVGPRPEIPYHVDRYKETIPLYMVKHQVKPGITGWAQINGYRGDTSIEERIKHDIWYIENWSLGLDIVIILKTLFSGMINREKIKV